MWVLGSWTLVMPAQQAFNPLDHLSSPCGRFLNLLRVLEVSSLGVLFFGHACGFLSVYLGYWSVTCTSLICQGNVLPKQVSCVPSLPSRGTIYKQCTPFFFSFLASLYNLGWPQTHDAPASVLYTAGVIAVCLPLLASFLT